MRHSRPPLYGAWPHPPTDHHPSLLSLIVDGHRTAHSADRRLSLECYGSLGAVRVKGDEQQTTMTKNREGGPQSCDFGQVETLTKLKVVMWVTGKGRKGPQSGICAHQFAGSALPLVLDVVTHPLRQTPDS